LSWGTEGSRLLLLLLLLLLLWELKPMLWLWRHVWELLLERVKCYLAKMVLTGWDDSHVHVLLVSIQNLLLLSLKHFYLML
jgi:hypothetical protein